MIVLKIIGGILLAMLALIVLALCIKVRIFAEYSDVDTNVRAQWLFVKIPLYPSKKKPKKDKNASENNTPAETVVEQIGEEIIEDTVPGAEDNTLQENAEAASDTTDTTDKNADKPKNSLLRLLYDAHGIDGIILIVKRLFNTLGTFFGDFSKSLVIDELYIDVMCNKNDAASTAIYYGEVCSTLFPMLGALVSKYKVRKYDINVYPDYIAKHSSASFAVSMHLYPIYVIGVSVGFVFRLLFKVLFRLIVKCIPVLKNKSTTADTKSTADKNTNNKNLESECS